MKLWRKKRAVWTRQANDPGVYLFRCGQCDKTSAIRFLFGVEDRISAENQHKHAQRSIFRAMQEHDHSGYLAELASRDSDLSV